MPVCDIMRGKPVKLFTLFLLCTHNVVLALDLVEGSGDDTLLDLEDGDVDDGPDLEEGSGGGWGDISFGSQNFNSNTNGVVNNGNKEDATVKDTDYYYDDNYDYLEAYINKENDYKQEENLIDYLDKEESAIEHEIEIAARPDNAAAEEEQIVLNTSQIFIMVGSSFISFAIFMLTFFLCRRIITNKQRKAMAYANTPEKPPLKEPPIVKDYQKVPTSAQCSSPRANMYGEKDPENPLAASLVP